MITRVDRKGRTKVHTLAQLRAAMGLGEEPFARARAAGLVPDADRAAGTYSGPLVEQLVRDTERIVSGLPDDLTQNQLMDALDMDYGQWRRAGDAGLIPDPDRGGFWTRQAADRIVERAAEIKARIPAQPLGAARCAVLLTELTGLSVAYEDVGQLGDRGLLHVVDWYKNVPLWDVDELSALAASESGAAAVAEIVGERVSWTLDSLTLTAAASYLGWSEHELTRVLAERAIAPGRYGRYSWADVARLKDDGDLGEQVRRRRLLGPRRSADHVGLRFTDFRYAVQLGWIVPHTHVLVDVGTRRRHEVSVPMYRVEHLESVEERTPAAVDWPALRGLAPGEPSPLRHFMSDAAPDAWGEASDMN